MFGVILLFERRSEQCSKGLIESGLESANESLDKVITGLVAFAVNEFDKEFALCQATSSHYRIILVPDTFFNFFQMFFTLLVILQALHIEICFNQYGLDLECYGIHFLDVAGKLVIFALLACGRINAFTVYDNLHHLKCGDRIAVNDGSQCHKHTFLLVIIGFCAKGRNAHYHGQYKYDDTFHVCKFINSHKKDLLLGQSFGKQTFLILIYYEEKIVNLLVCGTVIVRDSGLSPKYRNREMGERS